MIPFGYTNANFQLDPDDYASTSSYVLTLAGGAVSWRSVKQKAIVDSTTETKYIAAREGSKETVWYRRFLLLLGVVLPVEPPLLLYSDNGVVAQSKNPRDHSKMSM